MKNWKRLAYYLLLNILVSACTTLAVLVIWDQTRSPLPGGILTLAFSRSEATAPAPDTTPVPGTPGPTPLPTQEYDFYTVKEGDTFAQIAEEYGVSVETILEANGFKENTVLGVGENLRIPVEPGSPHASIPPGVVIDSVIGAGDLKTERVLLKRSGDGELSLANWKLQDQDGNVFVFPELTLFKDGAVNVLTGNGSNTVVDLYWGLDQPIWKPGEKAVLLDADGKERATYTVP